MIFSGKPFENPVTVRSEPAQLVRPDGTWEVQVVCDVDDFQLIWQALQSAAGTLHIRNDGNVIEVYSIHDTKTAAEGMIRAFSRGLKTVQGCDPACPPHKGEGSRIMECPECGTELEWIDYFGPHQGGGSIKKVGDIYQCQNEECDATHFHTFDSESGEPLHDGYPC